MKKLFKESLIAFAIFFFSMVSIVFSSSTITWTAAGPGNWSAGGNWSGGIAPASGDAVIFSASSTQSATIDTNVTVNSITITSNYTGTITQSSGKTITVGSGGFSQAAGNFTGSSAGNTITVNGPYTLTGGTFQSTSGQLLLAVSSTFSGIFQNNGGTVIIGPANGGSGISATITGSTTFNNFVLGASNNGGSPSASSIYTIPTGTVLTVQGYYYPATDGTRITYLGGGEMELQGNVEAGTTPNYATGTVAFVMDGTSTQILGDDSVSRLGYGQDYLVLPNLTIQKPATSTVILAGSDIILGNWTNASSTTINPGTSTVAIGPGLFGGAGVNATITGSSTFYNFIFGANHNGVSDGNSVFTIATGTILTVKGYLFPDTVSTYIQYLGGGEVDMQGNVEIGSSPKYATGTVTFVMNGSSTTQILGDNSIIGSSGDAVILPNLTIAKPSTSTVTFANDILIYGNWTNASGTIINPGTSTVAIGPNTVGLFTKGPGITATITGSTTFYNFIFGAMDNGNPDGSSIFTIATGTTLTVNGYLYPHTDGTSFTFLGGGEVDARGNIEAATNPGDTNGTSSVMFFMNGTSTQILGDDSESGQGYGPGLDQIMLPNINILKGNGSVAYGEGPIHINGATKVSLGEFSIATSTNTGSFRSDGPVTVLSGAEFTDYPVVSSTLKFGASVTNNGFVFFDGNGASCTAVKPNYVIINSTTTGKQIPWSGSGNFLMRFTNVQDQGGTSPISIWDGTNSGNNGANWTFSNGNPVPELTQVASSTGGAGTSQLTLPGFGFPSRAGDLVLVAVSARNQNITAPTDNASNTYVLVTSSTFGSSPSYALNLYYAKNIIPTSTLTVTANGDGSGSNYFLSAAAFEYTGISASGTFDRYSANTDTSGLATALTSLSAVGQWAQELYFGAATIASSTTANSGSGWTTETGVTNNSTLQALYNEDLASSSPLTTAATWTSAASTSYAAILGLFRSPYYLGYSPNGTLDSATFDTGVSSGAQLNSFTWQGLTPSGSSVSFQFAVSNLPTGPWTFVGPDGSGNTYFSGNAATPISLIGTSNNNGYTLFSGYRYFRYRVTLFADSTHIYSPTVRQVTVSWSP